jgi:hypothetical protein
VVVVGLESLSFKDRKVSMNRIVDLFESFIGKKEWLTRAI